MTDGGMHHDSGGGEVPRPPVRPPFQPAQIRMPAQSPAAAPAQEATPAGHAARALGLDLSEVFPRRAGAQDAASDVIEALKKNFVVVESAFQPSGEIPAGAIGAMVVGAVSGSLGGAVLGLVTFIAGMIVLFVVLAIGAGIVSCVHSSCIAGIFTLVGGLIFLCVMLILPAATGWGAAQTVGWLSRMGKNRNVSAARTSGAVAGFAAFLLLIVPFSATREAIVKQANATASESEILADNEYVASATEGREPGEMAPWCVGCLWVYGLYGLVCSLGVGLAVAGDEVLAAKFCEKCNLHMERRELGRLTAGGARLALTGVARSDLTLLPDTLKEAKGRDVAVVLFNCPECGDGYLELTAMAEISWKAGDQNQQEVQEWLIASIALPPREVSRLRRQVIGGEGHG